VSLRKWQAGPATTAWRSVQADCAPAVAVAGQPRKTLAATGIAQAIRSLRNMVDIFLKRRFDQVGAYVIADIMSTGTRNRTRSSYLAVSQRLNSQ
jgi:hypothetical protein